MQTNARIVLVGFLLLVSPGLAVAGLAAPPAGSDGVIAETLQAHYRLTSVRLDERVDGPAGLFHLMGDLTPKAWSKRVGGGEPETSRIAWAAVTELAPLLGLEDPAGQLRQERLEFSPSGGAHVLYRRYVGGLRVDQAEVRVHLTPEGKVSAVHGFLVVLPEEAREAVLEQTGPDLPQKDHMAALAASDLVRMGVTDVHIRSIEKVVSDKAPYVFWKADVVDGDGLGRWLYVIDAATGRILEKSDALESAALSTSLEPVSASGAGTYREKEGWDLSLEADPAKGNATFAPRQGVKEATGSGTGSVPGTVDEVDAAYAISAEAHEKRKVKP